MRTLNASFLQRAHCLSGDSPQPQTSRRWLGVVTTLAKPRNASSPVGHGQAATTLGRMISFLHDLVRTLGLSRAEVPAEAAGRSGKSPLSSGEPGGSAPEGNTESGCAHSASLGCADSSSWEWSGKKCAHGTATARAGDPHQERFLWPSATSLDR